MILGLCVFLASALFAFRGQEPFATWFYCFAWWSYILFVDGWVYRKRGESLLLTFPARFFGLALWSIPFWLFFELCNLRLENWSYAALPSSLPLRWLGYAVAYATVVPGILETADLLDSAGVAKNVKVKPLGWKKRVGPYAVAAGAAMLILPALLPKIFFPLVWGGLFLLLDPFNERMGSSSFLADWREGKVRRLVLVLLAGFLCGVLWEWWNVFSAAHWTYTVPWVGEFKVFEMPLFGYLGFAPFALEVFAATSFFLAAWERSSKPVRFLAALALAVFSVAMFRALDQYTVRSFQ